MTRVRFAKKTELILVGNDAESVAIADVRAHLALRQHRDRQYQRQGRTCAWRDCFLDRFRSSSLVRARATVRNIGMCILLPEANCSQQRPPRINNRRVFETRRRCHPMVGIPCSVTSLDESGSLVLSPRLHHHCCGAKRQDNHQVSPQQGGRGRYCGRSLPTKTLHLTPSRSWTRSCCHA